MILSKCLYRHGIYYIEYAYNIYDFPYDKLKDKCIDSYIELPATFDIETSTYLNQKLTFENDRNVYHAFMYHWQMCVNGYVVFGRTWQELQTFFRKLEKKLELSSKKRLVIYVHNLSFEFQFMYDFFNITKVFAMDKHKVLKFIANDVFEFRCSYYLSNMNLAKFIENTPNAIHMKGVGDLDYSIIRTPTTIMKPLENGYMYNDVRGLYEAVLWLLKEDNLNTIPLTSTGYVRRDCRNAMRKNPKNRQQFVNIQLNLEQYELCQECFRGGNTAGNRYYTNFILSAVESYDISSSYPYAIISEKYPVSKFMSASIDDIDELCYYNEKYCTIARYTFVNLRIKKGVPIPYLPHAKCNQISKPLNYNGRILSCDACNISLTNIDFAIIANQYEYDELYVNDFYFARKGYLPKELRDEVFKFFKLKCELKGNPEKYYEYMKSKNKLNAIYGMMVTNILREEYIFENGEFTVGEKSTLEKYYKSRNNFLSYQWGIFVTAYARKNLQRLIDIIGMDVVYCDTDSVKCLGKHYNDVMALNATIISENKKHKIIHSVNVNNLDYYMGTYDVEHSYDEFITMGAKKYAYVIDDEIGVTVSGLNKVDGAKELEEKGGLSSFRMGEVFSKSGRKVAYYNNTGVQDININDEIITTGSNIAIVDTTYTLGMSGTMLSILNTLENYDIMN